MLERFVRYTPFEIAQSGQVGDIEWHQLQARDAADSWVALDWPSFEFAFLRYHEALAVLFVTVGGLDQPTTWWRFDVVRRRRRILTRRPAKTWCDSGGSLLHLLDNYRVTPSHGLRLDQ